MGGRGSASALSLSAITAPTQATAGSSSAECPGEARGIIHRWVEVKRAVRGTVPWSSPAAGDVSRLYSYLRAPIAPSNGRCDGPLRHVPVPGCLALLAQHGDIPCPSNVASSAREPTPGRVANPQFGLTAKGCLACLLVQTPPCYTLPLLARTRPRGPGQDMAWMYRLAERYLVRTGDCAQHCPSTSRRCSVKSTLPSPSTVTNWQRSVPHPELVLVHSEP